MSYMQTLKEIIDIDAPLPTVFAMGDVDYYVSKRKQAEAARNLARSRMTKGPDQVAYNKLYLAARFHLRTYRDLVYAGRHEVI